MTSERQEGESTSGGAAGATSGPTAGASEAGAEEGSGATGAGGERGAGTGGGGRGAWTGPLSEIQEAVSEIVDTAIRGFGPGRSFPRRELVRVPGEGYRLYLDLPGVAREDVEVTTEGARLRIRGERRRPSFPEGAEVLRSDRGFGRFERDIRLPPEVDVAGVQARLEEGVLVVTLPPRPEMAPHRVDVEG